MKKMYSLYYFMKGDDNMRVKDFCSWEYMAKFIEDYYDKIKTVKYSTDNYESSETYYE